MLFSAGLILSTVASVFAGVYEVGHLSIAPASANPLPQAGNSPNGSSSPQVLYARSEPINIVCTNTWASVPQLTLAETGNSCQIRVLRLQGWQAHVYQGRGPQRPHQGRQPRGAGLCLPHSHEPRFR